MEKFGHKLSGSSQCKLILGGRCLEIDATNEAIKECGEHETEWLTMIWGSDLSIRALDSESKVSRDVPKTNGYFQLRNEYHDTVHLQMTMDGDPSKNMFSRLIDILLFFALVINFGSSELDGEIARENAKEPLKRTRLAFEGALFSIYKVHRTY